MHSQQYFQQIIPQSIVVEGNKYEVNKVIQDVPGINGVEIHYMCKTSGLHIEIRFQDMFFKQYSDMQLRDKIEQMVTDTIKRQLKEVWG